MTPSTNKKVLVARFGRDTLAGFINSANYLTPDGLELLSLTGTVQILPYPEVKMVAFVRDFGSGELKIEMKSFTARPKLEGLWLRLRFRDGDGLDGVLANNLTQLDGTGFMIVPPDAGSRNQRLFVPRLALTQVQVLGVVGSPLRMGKTKPTPKEQIELFNPG